MSHMERAGSRKDPTESRRGERSSTFSACWRAGTQCAQDRGLMVPTRSRARGFTLLEALVVVALVGIVVTIVVGTLQSTHQKLRLEAAANDIDSLLESAHAAMVNSQAEVFVGLQKEPWRLRVARDAALTDVLEEYVVPDHVNFSLAALDAVDTTWPAATADGPWRVRLDTFGRTTTPAGAPVAAVQTLTVTHRDVVTGRLTPRLRYEVRIYPLWRVDVAKEIVP